MPQTRSNLGQTPINSDTFNLTGDLATMADSLEVIVPVANQAAGDTVATNRAAAGFPVTDARPLFCWDQSTNTVIVKGTSGWKGGVKPLAHCGKTDGFTGAGATLNPVPITSQILRGGMTVVSNGIVVPKPGYYRITAKSYFSGSGTGSVNFYALKNGAGTGIGAWWTKQQVDEYQCSSGVLLLAANDSITLYSTQPAACNNWGAADGYGGTFLEVEALDEWF